MHTRPRHHPVGALTRDRAASTVLAGRLATIARVAASDPRVLGAHLEGPFLDHEFRGAHDPALLRARRRRMRSNCCSRRRAARSGRSRSRPSTPGRRRDRPVRRCRRGRGRRPHRRRLRTALAAFEPGASILTHAFNGMRGIHHRAPGPVVAAMHADHVTLEIINDGVHVHPDVVRLAFAGAPGRVALITDAMAAAGSADGRYLLGSLEVIVAGGVARLSRADRSPGRRSRRMRRCAARWSTAASRRRGRRRGHRDARRGDRPRRRLGRLDVGYAADAVLLTDELRRRRGAGAVRAGATRLNARRCGGPKACSPSPPNPRPGRAHRRPPIAAPPPARPAPPRGRVLEAAVRSAPAGAFTEETIHPWIYDARSRKIC